MKKLTLLTLATLTLTSIAPALADYLWPLPYGKELTSIFGSSRTRRYHAGIDIRTGGVTGRKVVAPTDAHVWRVRTSYYGYGKAIYLRLSDGNTAVFGHLSRFTPEVEEYVRQQQIDSESYKQDLYPPENMFRFKRGELVGYSGSTGVGAPHLHFEIRSPDNVPLNPLKFEGLEVEDNSFPRFETLKLIGLGNDVLAEALGWEIVHDFRRSADGIYRLSASLPCSDDPYWLSAEVVDFVSRNRWDKPTYKVRMHQGGKTIYELAYDELPFEEGYRIEIDRNFQAAGSGDNYFYNFLPRKIARDPLANGICAAIEDMNRPIEIEARDVAGNQSRAEISFSLDSALAGSFPVRKPDYRLLQRLLGDTGYMDSTLIASVITAGQELYLLIKLADENPKLINVSTGDLTGIGPAGVRELGEGFYLARVTQLVKNNSAELPHTLTVEQQDATGAVMYSEVPSYYSFPWGVDPNRRGRLISEDSRLEVIFPPLKDVFYSFDTHYFFRIDTIQTTEGTTYAIYPNNLPLAKQVTYRYTSNHVLPEGAEFYADAERELIYLGADRSVDGRRLVLSSYTLGKVTVRNDDIAPSIRQIRPRRGAVLVNARPKVSCVIRDEMSGIGEDIEIRIDGRWIVPVYDFESHRLTSESHFDLAPGSHTLVIKVTDRAGNTRIYDGKFSVASEN